MQEFGIASTEDSVSVKGLCTSDGQNAEVWAIASTEDSVSVKGLGDGDGEGYSPRQLAMPARQASGYCILVPPRPQAHCKHENYNGRGCQPMSQLQVPIHFWTAQKAQK